MRIFGLYVGFLRVSVYIRYFSYSGVGNFLPTMLFKIILTEIQNRVVMSEL